MLLAEESRHSPKAGLAASTAMFNNYLHDHGLGYDEFILGL